jgi:hypothetical protein
LATPERPAGGAKNDRQFRVPVCLGIAGGVFIVAFVELFGARHPIAADVRETALVVGGALVGLIALLLNDIFRTEPAFLHIEQERETERQRHQEERRLDFEQYRALQAQLRENHARVGSLEAKLKLTGALDRDHVGDALLLGFYFNRRDERLPSSPHQPVFTIAAQRLKVVTGTNPEVRLDRLALRAVLDIAYGALVSEAFDLGYVLSHLGEDGLPPTHNPEILAELEKHLNALKFDSKAHAAEGDTEENPGALRKLAARVVEIVMRRPG